MTRLRYMHNAIYKYSPQICLYVILRTSITIQGIVTLWSIFWFCRYFQTPVSKMRQISQKNLLERVLTKRHVFYIDSLTAIFCVPKTFHVSRIWQIFTTELLACGLPNFHPPYESFLHLETFTLSSQLFPNSSFENQAVSKGKICLSMFYTIHM